MKTTEQQKADEAMVLELARLYSKNTIEFIDELMNDRGLNEDEILSYAAEYCFDNTLNLEFLIDLMKESRKLRDQLNTSINMLNEQGKEITRLNEVIEELQQTGTFEDQN